MSGGAAPHGVTTVNPATGKVLESYTLFSLKQVGDRLEQLSSAQTLWRRAPAAERAQVLALLADELDRNAQSLAELIVHEMGKPFAQAQGEISKCVQCCRYYADYGPAMLAPEMVATQARRSYISYQPLGVILAIMPWNFPFWQAIRALAPALLAGNTVALKHASNTTGCALALERLVRAVYPLPLLSTLVIHHSTVAEVIADARVKGVTLTGSTPVGREVAAQAGRYLKKVVLELGGSDAYVVLGDAPVVPTAQACADARLINSGQSCIAAKRFIVVESIVDRFTEAFIDHFKSKVTGDPFHPSTNIGPLARADLSEQLAKQVQQCVQEGAQITYEGSAPRGAAFFKPTVLTGVPKGSFAAREELFGPVASILPAASDEEAIALANDSPYGLGAAIWTEDLERGERLAREQLEAGCCFVNHAVQSDPRLPFGGIKDSGFGRELSQIGLYEFTNIKTVSVK